MSRTRNMLRRSVARVGTLATVAVMAGAWAVGTFVVCALPASAAFAVAQPYAVDLGNTRVLFTVSHLGFSMQPGVFRDIDVRFAFDGAHPENSTLEVAIKAASIDMFYDQLNEHLRSRDFFNVEQFPDIKFHSTSVKMISADKATVTGDFTLLGVTKPVTFDVKLIRAAPHPTRKDVNVVGFGATGTIDRTAFGMTAYAPLVGKDIQFTISMEANDAPAR